MVNGDTSFQEKLMIQRIDTSWFYVADVPENQNPVRFEFTKMGTGEFIAVNLMHDFPKRIHYRVDAKNLKAVVSDGGSKKIEYSFIRID